MRNPPVAARRHPAAWAACSALTLRTDDVYRTRTALSVQDSPTSDGNAIIVVRRHDHLLRFLADRAFAFFVVARLRGRGAGARLGCGIEAASVASFAMYWYGIVPFPAP